MKSSKSKKASHSEDNYISELEYKIQMLTTFIDNSEAGLYVTDYYTGEILYANRKMTAMGGNRVSANEIIGTVCWKLMNPSGEGRCPFCPHEKLLNPNGTPNAPYVWENFFSKWNVWLKIISQAITWADGRLAQMTTFYDISETKEMQEKIAEHARQSEQWKMEQNLEILLDSLPLPVRTVDVETATITYVNNKFLEMFKYKSKKELIGKSITILMPNISSRGAKWQALMKDTLRSYEVKNTELEYINAMGEIFDARLTNCVIDLNNIKASVGIITDLSVEKAQKHLLMQEAERERESNRLKSNFLSNMSHEIRTPMNAIIGLTDIELRKKLPKEATGVYKKINSSAKNLLQIINDILDLSKIEADKIDLFPEEFELEEVLRGTLLVVSPMTARKQVELILDLSLDIPRFLTGDKTRLYQVLRNLVDNAAKFTSNGNIVLTVSEDKEKSTPETAFLQFKVEDTGIGMSEEQLNKVFLPYEQFYNEMQPRYSGTGLGMPISKRLCELMGGSLEASSTLGMGTVMQFTIPFSRSNKKDLIKDLEDFSCLSGKTALIINDNKPLSYTIEKLLRFCDAEYVTAKDSNRALKAIDNRDKTQTHFDIVIIDYAVEGMNGIKVAKLIQKDLTKSTKLLMINADEDLISSEELLSYGINGVIEKPFIPTQFAQKIREISGYEQNSESDSDEACVMFPDKQILVCEDNEINQEVVGAMLEQFGITAEFAFDGSNGIEILNSGKDFDLIFMDLHMPYMDGYEATHIIRSDPKYNKIPIISLTADAMSETINKCIEAGMNDFLTKPMDFEQLHNVLKKWL